MPKKSQPLKLTNFELHQHLVLAENYTLSEIEELKKWCEENASDDWAVYRGEMTFNHNPRKKLPFGREYPILRYHLRDRVVFMFENENDKTAFILAMSE